MTIQTLDDLIPVGKTVLVRVDLNLPMQNGKVSDDTRLEAIKPTLLELSDKGARVVLLAHFGRPKGKLNPDLSLRQILPSLMDNLGRDVAFADDAGAKDAIAALQNGDILLLENLRMYEGEEANTPEFAKHLASLGDVYVNDAFSVSHRAHASTEGIAHFLPSYAGRSMQKEVEALENALAKPQKPVAAIVGGAKVSTKLDLLSNLMEKVDMLLIGGGMANTFLAAKGLDVGKSLCEHELLDTARAIMAKADSAGCEIILPIDGLAAKEFRGHAPNRAALVDDIHKDEMWLDAGPKSIELALQKLGTAKTVVWNGPFGAFEIPPFDTATNKVAQFVAKRTIAGECLSVAGGGDTVSALKNAKAADDFSYVSTAGGAFLEWLEGKTLPGIAALMKKA